jgi:hypothetical protein
MPMPQHQHANDKLILLIIGMLLIAMSMHICTRIPIILLIIDMLMTNMQCTLTSIGSKLAYIDINRIYIDINWIHKLIKTRWSIDNGMER